MSRSFNKNDICYDLVINSTDLNILKYIAEKAIILYIEEINESICSEYVESVIKKYNNAIKLKRKICEEIKCRYGVIMLTISDINIIMYVLHKYENNLADANIYKSLSRDKSINDLMGKILSLN